MSKCLRAAAAAATCLALQASAATYDLAADWAAGPNPNGTWSYLSGSTALPYQASIAPLLGGGGYAPGADWGGFLPLFWQSAGPGSDILIHSYDGANGGGASGEARLAWTSPITGTIDLSGYLYYAQPTYVRANDVTLSLAATPLLSTVTGLLPGQHEDFANRLTFAYTGLAVTAGQQVTLDLVRTAGNTFGTITAVEMVVTTTPAVPEPATTGLWLAGIGALVAMRRGRAREPR